MDPDTTYAELVDRVRETLNNPGATTQDTLRLADLAHELAERFQALDDWIRRGGVPPRVWTRDHPTMHRDNYSAQPDESARQGWSYAELFPATGAAPGDQGRRYARGQ